jgi:acyl-CoA synthetase (NDP forming)
VGGSARQTSIGRAVLENILAGGFSGAVHLVNPRYDEIAGVRAAKSYDALPVAPDVVAIAVPPAALPDAVADAARKGTAVGIIITAGLGHGPGSLAAVAEKNARAAGMRLIGPNCLGVLVPGIKLNASFAARLRRPASSRGSRNRVRSPPVWCNGPPAAASDFPPSSPSATASTWASPTGSCSKIMVGSFVTAAR